MFPVSKNDPRYLSGDLVSITTGKVIVKDKYGKTSQADKTDPRYLSGELVSNMKGMVAVKDKNVNNNIMLIKENKYRYNSHRI
jgi:hypothetical protein